MTVAHPGPVIVPAGPGTGPTHAANATMSPTRAAGKFPIITVADPFAMIPGPPGTHDAIVQMIV
jgi:hypothetical protein